MAVRHQLSVGGQISQGRLLKHRVVSLDVIEHAGIHHHIASIDKAAVVVVFLTEGMDGASLVHVQDAESLADVHSGDGGRLSVGPMELLQSL